MRPWLQIVFLLASGCGIDDLTVEEIADASALHAARDAGTESGAGRRAHDNSALTAAGKATSGSAGRALAKPKDAGVPDEREPGKDNAAQSPDPAVEQAERLKAARQLADAECAWDARCVPSAFRFTFEDRADCAERRMLAYRRSIMLPGTAATAAALRDCSAATEEQTCDESLQNPAGPAKCMGAGMRPQGAACAEAFQCASGFCTAEPLSCGVCAEGPREGDPCARNGTCGGGLDCLCFDAMCTTSVCTRLRGAGEPCKPGSMMCAAGLNCERSGTCLPAPSEPGAPCDPEIGLFCDWQRAGLICQNRRCVPHTAASSCSATTYCEDPKTYCGPQGECRPLAEDDAACDARPCRLPAQCIAGLCKLPESWPTCED